MMCLSCRSCHAAPRRGLTALLLAALLVGCRDAESDPIALVLREAGDAWALDTELPSFPELSARAGVTPELRTALDLWESSWDEAGVEGQILRAEAYEQAAPELVQVFGSAEVGRLSLSVRRALEAIEPSEPSTSDPRVRSAVLRARMLQGQVDEALAEGDVAGALAFGLQASDALRAFSPSQVARDLLEQAETALAAAGDSLPGDQRARAVRLIEGAQSALATGEWTRAVQRAFYASQLLEQ